MWISALLGMVTKYSEIVLSIKYREKTEEGAYVGGPMYYIKNGLNCKWLAIVFAIFATAINADGKESGKDKAAR